MTIPNQASENFLETQYHDAEYFKFSFTNSSCTTGSPLPHSTLKNSFQTPIPHYSQVSLGKFYKLFSRYPSHMDQYIPLLYMGGPPNLLAPQKISKKFATNSNNQHIDHTNPSYV